MFTALTMSRSLSRYRAGAGGVLACLYMVLLAACGGGGDAAPPYTPPPTPTVTAPSALSYTSPFTATIGVAITALTPTVTGTTPTYTVSPALPAGLALNATSGVITGTGTVLADTATYTVTATNTAGSTTFPLSLKVGPSTATAFSQTNLVTNGAVTARTTDIKLTNPWGLVFATGAPAWLVNSGSQTSTLYDGTGLIVPTVVTIPVATSGTADPTGIVANSTTGFTITKNAVTAAARFIFAGKGGSISGWAPTVDAANAVTVYDDAPNGASYRGLAIATVGTTTLLYATDFKNKKIDVFNSTFAKTTVTGGFTDSTLPAGYAPYGIQTITLGGSPVIVVTYAQQNAGGTAEVTGAGLGLVNLFDTNGTLLKRLIPVGGKLNAPWGVALAPAAFGSFGNMLLIGNFGDGLINAFDTTSGVYAGTISNSTPAPLANSGLWAIAFGNGARNQPVNTLYFTAGVNGQLGGLYGRIDLGATAPDSIAPVVTQTAPVAGPVSGQVTLTATATDNVAVTKVDFLLRVGTTTTTIGSVTTAPYTLAWNSTTTANGAATLSAQAFDAAGNSTTSATLAVTINNVAAPALAQLQTDIFTPKCSGCHNGVGTILPGVMNLSSTATSFAALVNVASIEVPALMRVKPGDPNNSYIVHKLEGTQTQGARMPLVGGFLDQPTIDTVRAWIQAGAAP
ncbi:MAG: TIGR03118 family protein [Pseudomonadota bacterium]